MRTIATELIAIAATTSQSGVAPQTWQAEAPARPFHGGRDGVESTLQEHAFWLAGRSNALGGISKTVSGEIERPVILLRPFFDRSYGFSWSFLPTRSSLIRR